MIFFFRSYFYNYGSQPNSSHKRIQNFHMELLEGAGIRDEVVGYSVEIRTEKKQMFYRQKMFCM